MRVLKPGGPLVIAAPGKRHLWGLKEVLYDIPYENGENKFEFDAFINEGIFNINKKITVTGKEDINNLFIMTPYFWKTSSDGAFRLKDLERLESEIELELYVLKKKQ